MRDGINSRKVIDFSIGTYGISIISFSYGELVKYFVTFSLPFVENKKERAMINQIITRSMFFKRSKYSPYI